MMVYVGLTSRKPFVKSTSFLHPIIFKVLRGPRSSSSDFRHPTLTPDEMRNGCRLGIDTWADTSCAGKHAHVIEFVEGRSVTAHGFASCLDSIDDLSIANVAYAYDAPTGETFILVVNNAIYLGALMDDSLLNPIQCLQNGIRIDIRPSSAYPHDHTAQTVSVPSLDFAIPVEYNGVLPLLNVRRPTSNELASCTQVILTSGEYDWDPFDPSCAIAPVNITPHLQHAVDLCLDDHPLDDYLLDRTLGSDLCATRSLYPCESEESGYATIGKMATRSKNSLSPENLSRLWKIGIKTAERTLKATTHQCIRTTGALTRRFRTDHAHLRYRQLSTHHGLFYTDYLKSSVTSLRGYIGGNIYVNKLGFKKFFPMSTEQGAESAATLKSFIQMVGIPRSIHSDNHKNFAEGDFRRTCRKFHIPQTFTEAHTPWQNRAEPAIKEVKAYARRLMISTLTPIRLWCFCYEYAADILSLCASGRFDLQGRTSYEHVVGYTPDITEYVTFQWFQWCYYWDTDIKEKRVCRWLGPAHKVGQAMTFYLLTDTAHFIARSTVIPIPDDELHTDVVKTLTSRFMDAVESKIGNYKQPLYDSSNPNNIYYQAFDDPIDDDDIIELSEEFIDFPTADQNEAYFEELDHIIGAQVCLQDRDGSSPVLATVKGRKRDHLGNPVGTPNDNPILDSRVYNLQFPDGRVEEYAMNTIIEALHAQVDDDGYDIGFLNEIIGHRVDPSIAVPPDKGTYTVNGVDRPVRTTLGWDIHVKWKDGSTNWIPLSLLKESSPVLLAEYAVAHELHNLPAFKWWVSHVLRRRDRIIKVVHNRCRKGPRLKYGVEVPNNVEEAIALDEKNNNTLWVDAIKKEMLNSKIAFQLLGEGEPPPPGWKKITCHLVFDVKMDLRRKARYVAGGHLTKDLEVSTYASVVSRESVRIGFLVAALNGLNILAGDIQNAYLHAPSLEKNYFYAGDEWGADKDKVVLIVRALYGQKSSGAAWRDHLASVLSSPAIGFKSSLADPDVWYRANVKPTGEKYYSYIFVYTDDLLVIDTNPRYFMDLIASKFPVRPETIEEPTIYLGADISKVEFENLHNETTMCWSMGSSTYVKAAVNNVKERLKHDNLRFDPKLSDPKISAKQPFSSLSYLPELDTSAFCDDAQATYYQNLIGVLRWIVELGRIDINYEVAVLSRYNAAPRTGHLQQALHIFKYLDIHRDNELAFDPTYLPVPNPSHDTIASKTARMRRHYPDAQEALPSNAPEPRGMPVQINCFVDADHAGDRATRRSQTGILIYLNMAPIIWWSKRQTTVESSTYGSEICALKTATELIIALRYKLRMFGIPICDGPANVFCDNEAVYKSTSIADSRLKKKSLSIAYHKIREAVAAGIEMIFKEPSDTNLADILTKALPPLKRLFLRKRIMISCESNAAHSS